MPIDFSENGEKISGIHLRYSQLMTGWILRNPLMSEIVKCYEEISEKLARRHISVIEVGGVSACGGLEAEGQEFFASCLSEAILKRSAPEPKVPPLPF